MIDLLRPLMKEGSLNYIAEHYPNIRTLSNASEFELMQIPGFGTAKAKQLKAIFHLAKKILEPDQESIIIQSPKDVFDLCKHMALFEEEHFVVIYLTTKNQIIMKRTISVGDLNTTIVSPLSCFSPALKVHASGIVLCHNHPSCFNLNDDLSPSKQDIDVTKRLRDCGSLLNVNVLDHVIIGRSSFVSFKERGLLQ